jgi:hypothetical protein
MGIDHNSFGDGSIEIELFNYILENFDEGSTILELGSGWATGQLAKYFNMISIEHDINWLYEHNSDYIYAPLRHDGEDMWYATEAIRHDLNGKKYDVILVDGPTAHKKRWKKRRRGFLRHIDLFDVNVPIIFDDIDRAEDREHMIMASEYLKRPYKIIKGKKKEFGVV